MPLPPLPKNVTDRVRTMPFTPQRMVDWLNPLELARTGGRVILASVFGSYADKREVQAALDAADKTPNEGHHEQSEIWFDYIADVGDGFDATYTMAYLLAKESLENTGKSSTGPKRLTRGDLLFFGGDQVYPTASRDNYRDRMSAPYHCAFPEKVDGTPVAALTRRPELFAIPGNHDWYDGLTSFVRIFCQRRTIGAWQTQQRRSYFSVRLPHDWWIWGIDIQLEADIDDPQLAYFRDMAASMTEVCSACLAHKASQCPQCTPRKPKLILVTAEPAWVYAGHPACVKRGAIQSIPGAFDNVAFFISQTIERCGLDLRLMLAGDLHHYSRYVKDGHTGPGDMGSSQLVTSGGGGAYLSATHHLFPRLSVTSSDGKTTRTFARAATYPVKAESWRRSFGCFLLPFMSPWFAGLLGLAYLLLGWQLQTGSRVDCAFELSNAARPASAIVEPCWDAPTNIWANFGIRQAQGVDVASFGIRHLSLMDVLMERPPLGTALLWEARASREAPLFYVDLALLALLLFLFAQAISWTQRLLLALVHAAAHVAAVAVALAVAATMLARGASIAGTAGASYYSGDLQTGMFGWFLFIFGASVGTLIFASYLWLCAHLAVGAPHMNEVFSSRRYKDVKQFIRFYLMPDGRVKAFVIAVDKVVRRNGWRACNVPSPSLYVPAKEPVHRVIDEFEL